MNNYQHLILLYCIYIIFISIILFVCSHVYYNYFSYSNILIFIIYLIYIIRHSNKLYLRLNNTNIQNINDIRNKLKTNIKGQNSRMAIITVVMFRLLLYISSGNSYDKDIKSSSIKLILLSFVLSTIVPLILSHDIDLDELSLKKLILFDTIEFSIETISLFLFIIGAIPYITMMYKQL